MLARVFAATTILEVLGTSVETITVFSIFASVWKHWTLEFKIVSPLLHVLFSCAQLFGAKVFWGMAKLHAQKAIGEKAEEEVEQETVVVGVGEKEQEQENKQGVVTMVGRHEVSMV